MLKNNETLEGVTISFEKVNVTLGHVSILRDVTAIIPAGSRTAVVGPNGAGKSTFLRAILNEIPYTGKINVRATNGNSVRVGYVPQRLSFDRNLPIKVSEFLAMPLQKLPLWLGQRVNAKLQVEHALERVKSTGLANRFLGALSGGELQRVLLAAAIIREPNILLLDEPATGVDVHGEQIFCELLESVSQEMKLTQLMVSHDLATVLHHATHVICLNKSVIAAGSPKEVFTQDNLFALFGIHRSLVEVKDVFPVSQASQEVRKGCAHDHS